MVRVVMVDLFPLLFGDAGEEGCVGFVAEFKECVLICGYSLVLGVNRGVFLKLLVGESHASSWQVTMILGRCDVRVIELVP